MRALRRDRTIKRRGLKTRSYVQPYKQKGRVNTRPFLEG